MSLILVAHGSGVISSMVEKSINSAGHESIATSDGLECIELVYRSSPVCVVLGAGLENAGEAHVVSFLKNRRGVKDIPCIFLADEDTPAGELSLYDAVIQYDPDDDVELTAALDSFTEATIAWDEVDLEGESVTREMVSTLFIEHLQTKLSDTRFINTLSEECRWHISSVKSIAEESMKLLAGYAGLDVAVLLLEQKKRAVAYIFVGSDMFSEDIDDFMKVCLNDFYTYFKGLNLDDVQSHLFNVDWRDDFDRLRLDNKKISSYVFEPVKSDDGSIVGTLHLGHFTNNYYTDRVSQRFESFLKVFGPSLKNTLMYTEEHDTRSKIHHVFSKFVPEEIITSLVEKESDAELMVGEKRTIVVLFSDIRSFTTITETNHPEDVVNFLNRYFDLQVGIIKSHGGNIDKFIGDAIFAIFGAPISYEDNVERAVSAAVEMIEALKEIDVSSMNIPTGNVAIGIGLHEGDAIVGNIGSSTKFDYTAIGDTVNLAARLEGYTKFYKREVLLSQEVAQKISATHDVREVDYVKVKGKDIATSLFAIEFNGAIMEEDYLREYNKAYKMYKLGNFTTALEYYKELKEKIHDDHIVDLFIERCEKFINEKPENWDGSLSLGFK